MKFFMFLKVSSPFFWVRSFKEIFTNDHSDKKKKFKVLICTPFEV